MVAVGDGRGVDGLHVDLVLAVLHVDERAVVAVEELGVAGATSAAAAGFFEDVMVFFVAREHAGVALALHEESIVLHDRLEVNVGVGIFNHEGKNFCYTKFCFKFHRASPVSSFK